MLGTLVGGLTILAMYGTALWLLILGLRAIWKKEMKQRGSGRLLIGSEAIRAGGCSVVIGLSGIAFLTIALLSAIK